MMEVPRLIDRWFPVVAVDDAVRTTAGSGLTEKAIFTWFASRPLAQARAATLTALLPDDDGLRPLVDLAVRSGDKAAWDKLSELIVERHGGRRPVVLDPFSGRAIIPLEAARCGASSIGIDLSPVATFAGQLLADYPVRDWSREPQLPFGGGPAEGVLDVGVRGEEERLVADVRLILLEVGRRVADAMAPYYPRNAYGKFPWAYLWAVTMPCDGCRRRFPLVGSLVLRHPYRKTNDPGQSLRLVTAGDDWRVEVIDGGPDQQPTYMAAEKGDGKRRKGKAARCLFCGHIHPLDTVKAKGKAKQFVDALMVVADSNEEGKRVFRLPTTIEQASGESVPADISVDWPYPTVPDERIPEGNVHTVMASGYGYETFGELMALVKR